MNAEAKRTKQQDARDALLDEIKWRLDGREPERTIAAMTTDEVYQRLNELGYFWDSNDQIWKFV